MFTKNKKVVPELTLILRIEFRFLRCEVPRFFEDLVELIEYVAILHRQRPAEDSQVGSSYEVYKRTSNWTRSACDVSLVCEPVRSASSREAIGNRFDCKFCLISFGLELLVSFQSKFIAMN